jgi:Fur family transcriptional regulator, ferric uptake regulator
MTAAEILKHTGLNVTEQRILILQLFIRTDLPVKYSSIISLFSGSIHRGTVYRIVRLFVKKKILQMVPNTEGIVQYSILYQGARYAPTSNLHFDCTICGSSLFIKQELANAYSLPDGYEPERTEVIIKGRCNNCRAGT